MGTVTRMMAHIISDTMIVTPMKSSVSFGLMENAIISAPITMNGERSSRRSVRLTPFCTWLMSLVMRVTSVGVPMPSSSL